MKKEFEIQKREYARKKEEELAKNMDANANEKENDIKFEEGQTIEIETVNNKITNDNNMDRSITKDSRTKKIATVIVMLFLLLVLLAGFLYAMLYYLKYTCVL